MKDPAHVADTIIQEAFTPYFSEALPPCLGREIYLSIRRRLQTKCYLGEEHADEVFQQVVVDAYSFLARHGGHKIRHTRGWLHRISVNTTLHYLIERSRLDASAPPTLTEFLEGESQLPDDDSDDIDLDLVHQAIDNLRPRHQEVLRLKLGERLPDSEVQQRMSIPSNGYFRKVKCEALKALRAEMKRLSAN